MKKFLSLVLALVMTMSLVTVSAGAKDFTDDDKITYDEAVAVMSEVKVIDGYTDGSFQPTTNLTRGAAAKIICNLILGPTTAAALGADTAPYSDVPVNHTFAGYIAYCQKTGIISGYADGTFKPAAPLTGYAFMKMLLGALGYKSDVEGYTGANWSINVAKQAIAIGLADGNDDFTGQAYVNREEACLYSLNTLKATMVEYPQTTTVNVNGADVVLASARTEISWGTAKANDGNIKSDGYVQFAEKYFPDLELEVGEGIYGRPANTWKNKKAEIGTFTSIDPTYVYTESMDESDVYKDLGATITDKDEYDWSFYINGVEQKNGTIPGKNVDEEWAYTGEGTVTEIYVNDDEYTVDVIEYNYYLGQVNKVKSDDDGEYITISVISKGATLDDKTFYVDGYTEDDYVVFTVDENDDGDMVIGEVFEPEVATVEVTRVDQDTDTGATYLRTDDGKYTYTEDDKTPAQQQHMVYDLENVNVKAHPTLEEDYDLYLDPNGYVLGYALAGETVNQYLYVLDSDEELGDWVAKVLLTTGEVLKVELDDQYKSASNTKVDITWVDEHGVATTDEKTESNVDYQVWKYSVSDSGVYSLTKVAATEFGVPQANKEYTGEIHNGKAYITDGKNDIIVDKKTTFVDYMNETAYTGYTEVPDVENAHGFYIKDDNVAEVVFILDGDIYDANSTYFMLTGTNRESLKYDGDYYWDYSKAYVNGEKQSSLMVEYGALVGGKYGDPLEAGVLYKATKTVGENYITEVVAVTGSGDIVRKGSVYAVGDDAFWLTVNENKQFKFDCDDETVYVYVETDKDGDISISEGNINDMKAQDDYKTTVWVVKATNDNETARLVYIFAKSTEASEKPELSNDVEVVDVDIDTPNTTIQYYVESGVKTELSTQDIEAILVDEGCTDISKDGSNWNFTYGKTSYKNVTITCDQMIKVKVASEVTVDQYLKENFSATAALANGESFVYVKRGANATVDAVVTVVTKTTQTITAARDVNVTGDRGTVSFTGTDLMGADTYTPAGTDVKATGITVKANKDVTLSFELAQ